MIRADSNPIRPTRKLLNYFFSHIEINSEIVYAGTPCWLWDTIPSKGGYGRFKAQGVIGYAHVIACRMFRGAIPEELSCDHLCRRPICANPCHINYIPLDQNILIGDGPAARNARKIHCKNGHNLVEIKAGERFCRICANARASNKRRQEGTVPRIQGMCYRGIHALTLENSLIDGRNGNRSCRACKNIAARIRRASKLRSSNSRPALSDL